MTARKARLVKVGSLVRGRPPTTPRSFPARIVGFTAVAAMTAIGLFVVWPADPVVDGRTDIYGIQIFVYDTSRNRVSDTGVTFLDLTPYEAEGGIGTKIVVVPVHSDEATDFTPRVINLVLKVPAELWGGADECDSIHENSWCTEVAGNWKKVVFSETWDPTSMDVLFKDAVFIPPHNGVGYGVGANASHIAVTVPQIVLPPTSVDLFPDVVLRIPNWRSFQWEGAAPGSAITGTSDDDTPAFLLSGSVVDGLYFSPGFTSYAYNPGQVQRDNQNLLLTGALLGILGGVLVALVTELLPASARAGGSDP